MLAGPRVEGSLVLASTFVEFMKMQLPVLHHTKRAAMEGHKTQLWLEGKNKHRLLSLGSREAELKGSRLKFFCVILKQTVYEVVTQG